VIGKLSCCPVLWLARTGAPWCDLPKTFGKWFTVYTRFWRWAHKGVWEGCSRFYPRIQISHMLPSMRRWSGSINMEKNWRKRGTQNQAIGKSRRGLTTKIAVIADALGNLVRFVLLPGQHHDITAFDPLIAGIYCLALIGDKAFDAHWLRNQLRADNIEAVIPLREGTTGYAEHDREKYKWRHLVKNLFCRLKTFRRIATRYEKTDKLHGDDQLGRRCSLDTMNVNSP
jgi:transposase